MTPIAAIPTRNPRRQVLCLAVTATIMLAVSPVSAETWVETQKLLATEGHAAAFFGSALSMDGDTAIVGAIFDRGEGDIDEERGAAYIFQRDSAGTWQEQAKLVPTSSGLNHRFAYSVDIDGDTAVAGIFEEDLNPVAAAAYVFTRDSAGHWSEQALLTPSDYLFGDGFSVSVAVDGGTILVGTRPETSTGFIDRPGAVYVFVRDAGGNWTQRQKLMASDGEIGDTFGRNIDLDGNTAIIGRHTNAPGTDSEGRDTVRAAAYIFRRNAAGSWTERAKLLAAKRTAASGEFGPPHAVAVDGNTAIFSAGELRNGRSVAYAFRRHHGTWHREAELSNSDGMDDDGFGQSMALVHHSVIIGAPYVVNGGAPGAAYIFKRQPSGRWHEEQKLTADDGEVDDHFGEGVAFNGETVIATAPYDDDIGESSGSAYVYETVGRLHVDIDVRPASAENRIRPGSRATVLVAVLSDITTGFDPLQIKVRSLRLGPGEARPTEHRVRDVNGDGVDDLLAHFPIRRTRIACGDSELTLKGKTYAGETITGTDHITTVRCP